MKQDHNLGNFHTNVENDVFSIMDEGGFTIFHDAGLPDITGGVFGENSVEVMFTKDEYSFFEGAIGLDETDVNTAYGLTSKPHTSYFARTSDESTDVSEIEKIALAEVAKVLPEDVIHSYPNPVNLNGTSNLIISTARDEIVELSLYDINGHQVTVLYNGQLRGGEAKEIAINLA